MNDVTAIMPAWTLNDEIQKLTENAIESIGDVPLVIIDNASPQGGGYLRSKATTYVRNSENLGFAKAVNQGINLAKTRYVLVVSTDVRLSPNWPDALKLFRYDTFSVHFRMTDYDVPFAYGTTVAHQGKERWCTAATFLLDKQKGLWFDEGYFNSFEDWDLFYRAHKGGYETLYTDTVCFQHQHSFTQRFVGFKGSEENRKIFTLKHGEDPDVLLQKTYPEQMKQDYYGGFNI